MYSEIVGTGSYVPEKVLTNQDFEKMVDTSDKWITERTGIKERHIASDGEATSDLASRAAIKACEMADVSPESLDLILCATGTPDHNFPGISCIVQKNLNSKKAAAFDIQAACSGFIYGLSVADNFIRGKQFKRILLVGAEKLSFLTDYKDRETCVLFGDAAGAVVLVPSDEPGILSTHLGSFGEHWELLMAPAGGSRKPLCADNISEGQQYIKMKGREVFKYAVTGLTDFALKALEENNLGINDIQHIVPHQANNRIIEAFSRRADIPIERFVINLEKYGNTSSASIPLALDEACRSGRFKKGDLILSAAFGAGLTVASTIFRWTMGEQGS